MDFNKIKRRITEVPKVGALQALKLLPLLLAGAVVTALGVGVSCSGSVDTTKDFAMVSNGREYRVALGSPTANIREVESGFSNSSTYSIRFPTKQFNRFGTNGFELGFDPGSIEIGEVIESRANDQNYSTSLSYYPLVGHKLSEGLMLEYSSRISTGSVKVRFDILEPEIGGRVKGKILEATLFGFYQQEGSGSMDSPGTGEPSDPLKLEIYNFVFDTTFVSSTF